MSTLFRVTLLGTGVPIPPGRSLRASTLIEAGEQTVLIDAGRGATIRLFQLGIPIGRINALSRARRKPNGRFRISARIVQCPTSMRGSTQWGW